MAYIGLEPSNSFVSLKRQVITGDGTASYTLDHSVASVNDVAIFVNNVRQDPAGYSISGTALTLGGTISSSDSCYVIFLGQALQTVTPDANTITTAMMQDSAITTAKINDDAVTSAKVSGLGNYVVEKIDVYTNGTSVTGSGSISYVDIAGGNFLTFTPTSTSDYILFKGMCMMYVASGDRGVGLGIKRDTSTSISSSSDTVEFQGRYANYSSSSANYYAGNIIGSDTGLTAGTTYYYEMYGAIHSDGGNKVFNMDTTGSLAGSRHKLIGIHYKYIG